ncbi:cupin domain-containing protein [Rhizobium laguerreae]|uniref:cupin domain-containing protein n=1 Tax=Rhizobium laguerreae TaxID=1076926 RepID=UPI001C91590F|nr:cupin domain-containing protein [Rhizobium laguerreae]MBY3090546.1 cupin domain-containing protein [Rhizobium laguerreae]
MKNEATQPKNPSKNPHGLTAKVVRGSGSHAAEQGSVYRSGISAQSVGSSMLWLGMISLPAGRRTKAHRHEGHETALLMTAGQEIEIWSGPELERCELVHAGDYLFIPAGVPHVAVNRSTESAEFLGARNDPAANESVVLMPELDNIVP